LRDFLSVFQFSEKIYPTKPTHPLGTIFAVKTAVFSIHFSYTETTEKKTGKPLKIKGLRFFGKLFGSFSVAFQKLASLLKTCYNKAPYP
jgi:hypothetical protein